MKNLSFKKLGAAFILSAVLFAGCGGNGNTPEITDNNPTPQKPAPEIQITAQTFAGQVYYLDGPRSVIDTTRDRIVFDSTDDGCTIYIGDKTFTGNYSVNLQTRKITITEATASDNTTLEGTLSYSEDAKDVVFSGTQTESDGTQTSVTKSGTIKWDYSESGEWNTQEIPVMKVYNNTVYPGVKESSPIQAWTGEIDFTNSAYTKGMKIPAEQFANINANDTIAFVYPNTTDVFYFNKYEGLEIQYTGYIKTEYYHYVEYKLSQENLDYIRSQGELILFGHGNKLIGIVIGSNFDILASSRCIFEKKYSGYTTTKFINENGNELYNTVDFTIYDNPLGNERTIVLDILKYKNFSIVTDSYGLSYNSPDKDVYRAYKGTINMQDEDFTIDLYELSYTISDSSNWNILNTLSNGNKVYLLESTASTPLPIQINLTMVGDEYKLSIDESTIPEALEDIFAPTNFAGDILPEWSIPLELMTIFSNTDMSINYSDVANHGSWKTTCVDYFPEGQETLVTEPITYWEGLLKDNSTVQPRDGFNIPKDKFASLTTDDYVIFGFPADKAENIGNFSWKIKMNNNSYGEIFKDLVQTEKPCTFTDSTTPVYLLMARVNESFIQEIKENGLKFWPGDFEISLFAITSSQAMWVSWNTISD